MPGFKLDYVEITSSVNPVTSTADGTSGGTAVIDGNSVSYDGSTPICIEFFCPELFISPNTAGHAIYVNLYDGTTDLGRLAQLRGDVASASFSAPVLVRRFLTPSNASHTYHIRAWKDNSGDTAAVLCGAGGASTLMPAYYRITVA